jgi:AraC-like DNA-binding protein/quercetin dioxygenase-like cupin family protein
MVIYLSFSQIAAEIENLYHEKGSRPSLLDAVSSLNQNGHFLTESPNKELIEKLSSAKEDDFLAMMNQLCIEFDQDIIAANLNEKPDKNSGNELQSWTRGYPANTFMSYVFYKEASSPHLARDYFEMDYVYKGKCELLYEGSKYDLSAGDMCLIPPMALHDVRIRDRDTFLIQQLLNYNTFYSAFISLLSENNILSDFFKALLLNKSSTNYLLLSTGNSFQLRSIARNLFLEQYRYDSYAPQCSTDWLRILFTYVLRFVGENYRFSGSNNNLDYAGILKFLNVNYRTTTLQEVADHFHYSSSYLSTSIKQMTGKTYSELIRNLKMADARHYLETTDKSVDEISALVGYNSTDQFSRTFRDYHHLTPSAYRKNHNCGGSYHDSSSFYERPWAGRCNSSTAAPGVF